MLVVIEMNLKYLRTVYQVLVSNQLVCVMENFEEAKKFANDHYKDVGAIIIPVPIFTYT